MTNKQGKQDPYKPTKKLPDYDVFDDEENVDRLTDEAREEADYLAQLRFEQAEERYLDSFAD